MSARIYLDSPARRLAPGSAEWPPSLNELEDAPAQLFVAGELPSLERAVAVVGTRFASEDGLRFARQLARELAAEGVPVVSGGAAGIDAAAHMGALEAGGRTLAILATGLTDAYPRHHGRLFSQIARSGALLCEWEGPISRGGWVFLRRNRLIAALAPTLVVVQAPYKSGALSTAHWAHTLKRRVFAVPAGPWEEHGQGCLALLRQGAGICTSAADILSVATFGAGGGPRRRSTLRKQINDHGGLAANTRKVWQCVRRGVRHPDEISAALDMPAAEVQEALLDLVLHGLCRQRADGGYVADDS